MTKPVLLVAIASLTLPLMAIPVLKKRTPESHQVPSSTATTTAAPVPVASPATPVAAPGNGEKSRAPRAPSGLRVKFQ